MSYRKGVVWQFCSEMRRWHTDPVLDWQNLRANPIAKHFSSCCQADRYDDRYFPHFSRLTSEYGRLATQI